MKKRKYLALLLAAGMIVQTALSTGGVVQVQAAEDTYVKTDELTDNDTAAPKKDSVIPSKNQYEYQKQELAAFCHFGMNTYTNTINMTVLLLAVLASLMMAIANTP